MPPSFDPPSNIPLYNYSNYLSPAHTSTDFFNSWPLGFGSSPQSYSSALYNDSNFLIPGFFDSNYFDSISYNNQSGGSNPVIINMTALITPTFSFTNEGIKNFILNSIMSPIFSSNTQMVEGIIFGTVITPDFGISSNTAVFYSMSTNISPTFTFSSPPVGKLRRKSFTLAIDKGYFAARQGPHVLNFYVMAR